MAHRTNGFSLIELVVVLGILAIFFLLVFGILNPLNQIEKSKDAGRQQDLEQVRNSIDTYYNDNGCYPVTVPFGTTFSQGNTLYMNQLPFDSECNTRTGQGCYNYQVDSTSSCPQWNILYAKLRATPVNNVNDTSIVPLCPLYNIPNCLPANIYSYGYNFCLTSGTVDCTYLDSHLIPSPYLNISPTPTTVPTPTTRPTQACTVMKYKCTAIDQTNPNGVCNNVCSQIDPNTGECTQASGDHCGYPGCVGNDCCDDQCSQ